MTVQHGGGDHIHSLFASDLAYNDPVRPHPESGSDQIPYRHRSFALQIRLPSLKPYQVLHTPDLKLRIILYGDDPLSLGDKVGKRIEKCRLSRPGSSADEDIVFCTHQLF